MDGSFNKGRKKRDGLLRKEIEMKSRVLDLKNTELANQWWQLYDTKTKKFYYYNIKEQKTSWTKPSESLVNDNQIIFLANRIINRIKKNFDLTENPAEIKQKLDLDKDFMLLEGIFKKELDSPSIDKSLAAFLSSPSVQPFICNQESTRRLQPRTNPNYISVNLIDKESGSLLRNTYIKLDQINDQGGPVAEDKQTYAIKQRTDSKAKLTDSNQSINNVEDLNQISLVLNELLANKPKLNASSSSSSPSSSSSSANTICFSQKDGTDTRSEALKNGSKLEAKNFSISSCFLASLKDNKEKPCVNASCSLSRKKVEKKFSFLCSEPSKKCDSVKNSKNSEDNLCDASSALKAQTFFFSPSSTTSLADLNNFGHHEKHHRFKNLRRSFNKTPKCTTDTKNPTSLSYMIQSSHSKLKLDIENYSPQLARKPSEANLLIIKKNQIDLNVHHEKFGGFLFFSSKKKIPDQDLMVWTSQTIQKPLIKTNNKVIKKEARDLFKMIQIYMGDRKTLINMTNQDSLKKSAPMFSESTFVQQLTAPCVNDSVCLEIMTKGWMHPQLRDELYLQIVKQTTQNLNLHSSLLGWQLMAVCLNFFPPTLKLYPFVKEYILSHLSESADCDLVAESSEFSTRLARTCLKRLEKINATGAKKGLKNPSIEEVLLAKSTILNPSLFGASLEEIMSVQRKKFPQLQLPWIQKVLSEAVLHLNGTKTEGIFRVPGDLDEVNNLKVRMEQLWCSTEDVLSDDLDILKNITDPHLPASLLKLWYRELYEPLIPNELYDECIQNCDQAEKCLAIIKKLPHLNRMVFTYLVRFLKVFADPSNVAVTKMDANNLSMVMAPNCLRCKSNDPKTIMENTKKEMQFIKTLIQHLDTSIQF